MLKKMKLLSFFAILFLTSCAQNKSTPKEIKVVGSISLLKPDTKTDLGYILVLREEEYDKNIIYNYFTAEVSGNDTLLLVRCRNRQESAAYFKVTHNKGQLPYQTEKITFEEYLRQKSAIRSIYNYKEEK
jgi:hypothetical protein